MDNLGDLLAPILSDPEAIRRLSETAQSLGLDAMLGAQTQRTQENAAQSDEKSTQKDTQDMLSSIMQFAPLLSNLGGQDDNAARLLGALRPYLGKERQLRLEEAQRLLVLMRVAPMLRSVLGLEKEESK